MVRPLVPTAAGGPAGGGPAVPTNLGNRSIWPLSYALSSGLSLWPWSAVSACAGDNRNGLTAPEPLAGLFLFGLLLSRSTPPPSGAKWLLTSSGVARLLTTGVFFVALNGVSPG